MLIYYTLYMGLFSRLFGKKDKEEQRIFYAEQNERMEKAYLRAQESFKYFWRELYWEYRRIVPALDLAIVKVPFEQKSEGFEEALVEHMWINQIDFDGEQIQGILMNTPNQLTNIAEGDKVSVEVSKISDWMFASLGKTYGGFTIQLLRSEMKERARKQHDSAWGLDFGDPAYIQVVVDEKKHPDNLIEHPMSKNMAAKMRAYLKENPSGIKEPDSHGHSPLHREAIAGNKTNIEILLHLGADKTLKTAHGKTPLDFAKKLGWDHVFELLDT